MVIDAYNNWNAKQPIYSFGLCCVALVCFIVIGIVWSDNSANETKYIVSVDDSVSFNEFQKMYEIIDRNGENYVVRLVGNLDVEVGDVGDVKNVGSSE
jgi:hypothetical protein